MTTRNPWLGLASYDVPKGMEEDYLFCGRDEETMDIVRLIDNNLFITLYGSSGIGKTSLLKAGVIPILKRKDYFPLYVRLSQESNEISYAEAIVKQLKNCGLKEESHVALEHADGDDRLYLWNYFATTQFFDADGREIYPVIILDQFEEVFRDGDKAKAELLLQQIYLLLNDELEMPDAEGYSSDTNYRFVASIREDYLFVLEDSIDELSLDLYKSNRYRLRPMKPENARQVVLVPGRDCIEESEKEKVAERVLELAKKPQSDDIDTLLLSLVCAGTFDKKAGEKITYSDLSIWKDNPMQIYYQDAMSVLNANQIRYIQQNLIREDGSRKRVSVEKLKNALGENDFQELTKGKNRLFSIGDKGQVELLHDKLAMAVYEERKAFEERERKKKLRRRVSVIGIVILAIAGLFIFQNHSLKQQRQKILENQLRFVSEKAMALTDKGDSYSARVLALDLLPENVENASYLPEAEAALRHAYAHQSAILKGHKSAVNTVRYSSDGNYILSASWDGTVKLWDAQSGICLRTFTGRTDTLQLKIEWADFLQSDKSIISRTTNNILIIWDLETGNIIKRIEGCYMSTISDDFYLLKANDAWEIWDSKTLERVEIDAKKWYPLTWYPDNQWILALSMTSNNEFYRINIVTGESVSLFYDDLDSRTLWEAISPMENQIAISYGYMDGRPGYVKIRDAWTGELLHTLQGGRWTNGVSYNPDGKLIASTSMDGLVRLWDTENGSIVNVFNGHIFASGSPCYSPDGKCLITSSADNTIRIWDVPKMNDTIGIVKTKGKVYSISYHPDGKQLLISYPDSLCLYDAITKQWIKTLSKQDTINHVAFSPTGDIVAASFMDGHIGLLDLSTNKWKILKYKCFSHFSFNTDGSQLASSNENDSTIYIWDVATGECIKSIHWHQKVLDFAFINNNERILVESEDSTINSWNICNKQCVFLWKSTTSRFASSADGKYLLTRDHDKVYLWNTETRKCINTFTHNSFVYVYCFSHDGRYVVTTTHDLLVNVWDRESGVCLYSRKMKQYGFAQMSSNNRHIALQSTNEVRIIDYPPLQELINQTRERFKDRPLTEEERKMYYLE